MSKNFIKDSVEDFNDQQINFVSKIGNYTLDKVDAADILLIKADSKYLSWEIATRKLYISNGVSFTNFGNSLFRGVDEGQPAVPPAVPVVVVAPPSVNPGMRTRFSNIAADAKRSSGYTENIGIDLEIEIAATVFVPAAGKPVVKSELHVGHPFFRYVKDGYQGVQIYKNSSDGHGFVKYDKAINSTYVDNAALPAVGVAAVWQYKFVYIYQGVEVGTASAVVEVLVTGM